MKSSQKRVAWAEKGAVEGGRATSDEKAVDVTRSGDVDGIRISRSFDVTASTPPISLKKRSAFNTQRVARSSQDNVSIEVAALEEEADALLVEIGIAKAKGLGKDLV